MRNERLLKLYEAFEPEITKALDSFQDVRRNPSKVWEEMVFCLCTPQTRARSALKAVEMLKSSGLLEKPDVSETASVLRRCGVRFHKTKARYIAEAFKNFHQVLKLIENCGDVCSLRDSLVGCVKGMGMKEASHFLRNIGFDGVAIIDRHVLNYLSAVGVVRRKPKTITRKQYLMLEMRFKECAEKAGLNPSVLDLVVWADATGEVLK
ncbi:MAG: N-glycosylase/DNA lyase [Candidatus Caldarchaeum sp.]|nr:N-glycosylase/DNA lyase [Candidatus Caldarchaeum sp.]